MELAQVLRTLLTAAAVAAVQLVSGADVAAAAGRVVRLAGGSISVASLTAPRGAGRLDLSVTVTDMGRRPLGVRRSDFELSADGDMFGVSAWNGGGGAMTVPAGSSRVARLSFDVPSGVAQRASLAYRPAGSARLGHAPASAVVTVTPTSGSSAAVQPQAIASISLAPGAADPWGTAIDGSGDIWFAEPGCDFSPTCPARSPPGQIGEFDPASGAVSHYNLPNIAGNQPIFLSFDSAGNLWFTTPDNSMIGEFSPASHSFVGQWPVAPGSGPWDLTFAGGQIWYTEHLVSAIGRFDPSTHAYRDFPTPSANSNPYGIVASGTDVWFTENNSTVDRVGVLDTSSDTIAEYPILASPVNSTPHLIRVDAGGHPWWTEGWSGTIGTLDPAIASPGTCGASSGPCVGIQRFQLPRSSVCGGATHVSGIAVQGAGGLVWVDDSLAGLVGSFNPATQAFALSSLNNCNAHPHDGLNLDGGGDVWYDEEFANALGELIPAGAPNPQMPVSVAVVPSPPVAASPATFTASFTGSAGVPSVRWSFGDGASARGNPAVHTYTTPGSRTLSALITQVSGATEQLSETISVAPAPAAPVNQSPPVITGNAQQGQTLVATTGSWSGSPTSYSYQWEECTSAGGCVTIAGAAASAYALTATDVGHAVRVQVTASNLAGPGAPATSGPTAVILGAPSGSPGPNPPRSPPPLVLPAPTDLGLPSISGTTEEGQTLFARTGIWGNDPTAYSYQWQRCAPRCSDVTGATGTSYTAVAADIGARLRVLVSARNPGGTTVAATPLLGPVGPSATRVRTALRTLLGRLSAHRTLAMLLRGRGCALRFDAPSGGVLTLRWSVTPPGGRRDAGRAIAAFVVRVWARRGPGVMVQLTPRLARWLTRQGGPRALVTAKFSAVGGPTLVRGKWFLLKGRST